MRARVARHHRDRRLPAVQLRHGRRDRRGAGIARRPAGIDEAARHRRHRDARRARRRPARLGPARARGSAEARPHGRHARSRAGLQSRRDRDRASPAAGCVRRGAGQAPAGRLPSGDGSRRNVARGTPSGRSPARSGSPISSAAPALSRCASRAGARCSPPTPTPRRSRRSRARPRRRRDCARSRPRRAISSGVRSEPTNSPRSTRSLFDPPRAGALAQSRALAAAALPLVVAISCNAASFARDARILVDGGYQIEAVTPLDQFRFSPHVEIVAVFRRPSRKRARGGFSVNATKRDAILASLRNIVGPAHVLTDPSFSPAPSSSRAASITAGRWRWCARPRRRKSRRRRSLQRGAVRHRAAGRQYRAGRRTDAGRERRGDHPLVQRLRRRPRDRPRRRRDDRRSGRHARRGAGRGARRRPAVSAVARFGGELHHRRQSLDQRRRRRGDRLRQCARSRHRASRSCWPTGGSSTP